MNTLSKTLMMAATLTLAGACDAEDVDFGDGDDVALRPGGFGGIKLNTSLLTDGVGVNGHVVAELDVMGAAHKGTALTKVCVMVKNDPVCLFPKKGDKIYVQDGEIIGEKLGWGAFTGADFANSRWFIGIDFDLDGSFDSAAVMQILAADFRVTSSGIKYWGYTWAHNPLEAKGLITQKWEIGKEEAVPLCEVDIDTGSIGSVVMKDITVDLEPGTKADVDHRPDTLYIACDSGALGKTASWNYVHHDMGDKGLEVATRVVRADYCNNGSSFTKPGQALLVDDARGYNSAYDPNEKTELLAHFNKGILCVNPDALRYATIAEVEAECVVDFCKEDATWWDFKVDVMTQAIAP